MNGDAVEAPNSLGGDGRTLHQRLQSIISPGRHSTPVHGSTDFFISEAKEEIDNFCFLQFERRVICRQSVPQHLPEIPNVKLLTA